MKTWMDAEFMVLDIAETACINNNNPSGDEYFDRGTCHNKYWAGNGLTKEEATINNPYWGGAWGSNGGWGSR